MEITSVNNELVKDTVKLQQKKYRDKSGKFILEGRKSVEEACQYGILIDYAFVLQEKANEYGYLKDKLILTNEAVLKKFLQQILRLKLLRLQFKNSMTKIF